MSKTGRYTISKGGRTFLVEPISPFFDRNGEWGGPDLSNMPVNGAVHPNDSIITEENGFTNIQILPPGTSPDGVVSDL